MYLSKTPEIIKPLAKDFLWQVDTQSKHLFLTFDDGPTAGVTEDVLDLLKDYQAKASFFCVGNNISKAPKLYQRILDEAHTVGNHSYNHENGWKTTTFSYLKSYLNCSKVVDSKWFRPPYGKITKSQSQAIKQRSTIVMWDVLSGDFDSNSTPEDCAKRVIKHAKEGSIIVFHDSLKAKDNMLFGLKRCLEHFTNQGFTFLSLNNQEFGQT